MGSKNASLAVILRQAEMTSHSQKRRRHKKNYARKEELLRQALEHHRGQLWVGIDPARPTCLSIIGPSGKIGCPIALHIPRKRAEELGLMSLIGELNRPEVMPL